MAATAENWLALRVRGAPLAGLDGIHLCFPQTTAAAAAAGAAGCLSVGSPCRRLAKSKRLVGDRVKTLWQFERAPGLGCEEEDEGEVAKRLLRPGKPPVYVYSFAEEAAVGQVSQFSAWKTARGELLPEMTVTAIAGAGTAALAAGTEVSGLETVEELYVRTVAAQHLLLTELTLDDVAEVALRVQTDLVRMVDSRALSEELRLFAAAVDCETRLLTGPSLEAVHCFRGLDEAGMTPPSFAAIPYSPLNCFTAAPAASAASAQRCLRSHIWARLAFLEVVHEVSLLDTAERLRSWLLDQREELVSAAISTSSSFVRGPGQLLGLSAWLQMLSAGEPFLLDAQWPETSVLQSCLHQLCSAASPSWARLFSGFDHELFSTVCQSAQWQLERHAPDVWSRDALRVLALTLQSRGLVEESARLLLRGVERAGLPTFASFAEVAASHGFSDEFQSRWEQLRIVSSNVRAMESLLRAVFPQALSLSGLLGDSDWFGLLMSSLFKAAAPVMLDAPGSDAGGRAWTSETFLLHEALVPVLREIVRAVQNETAVAPESFLSLDPLTALGMRGLFLEAYQGFAPVLAELFAPHEQPRGLDGPTPEKLYLELLQALRPDSVWPWRWEGPKPNTSARLKVGFVSSFFSSHSVGRLLAAVMAGLADQPGLDVTCIHLRTRAPGSFDPASPGANANEAVEGLLKGSGLPRVVIDARQGLEACVAELRAGDWDVLVFGDVFMDSFTSHLLLFRSAPVQVLFWGHPFSAGSPDSVDYFITADSFEPDFGPGRTRQFHEQLVAFRSLTFRMAPPARPLARAVDLGQIVRAEGFDLWDSSLRLGRLRLRPNGAELLDRLSRPDNLRFYGCFQSLMKMHPLFDGLILELLRLDPSAVILLSRTPAQLQSMHRLQARLRRTFAAAQLPAEAWSRVVFLDQRPHAEYLLLVCSVAVNLDPFPFGGGVTLMDSLSGCENGPVPFATLGSLQSVHRLGQGLARALNDSSLALDGATAVSASSISTQPITEFTQQIVQLARTTTTTTTARSSYNDAEAIISALSTGVVAEWAEFLASIGHRRSSIFT